MSQTTHGYARGQQPYNFQQSSYTQMNEPHLTNARDGGFPSPNVPSNPLSEYLAQLLEKVEDLCNEVSHQLYTNSAVIVIAAGLAGGVHYFASQKSPLANAALDATFHGTVAVAKYVGLSFFIKTA
ncbi:MAG TPA: hypothetical protein VLG69_03910, partial [Candidatus Andersenbacteria bacterium]|nr:hypothetical protein [Candidatus Andersenbacteria bacterium]